MSIFATTLCRVTSASTLRLSPFPFRTSCMRAIWRSDCLYCHHSAAKGPHAGIPSSSLCLNCHKLVTASWKVTSTELDEARQANRPPRRIVSAELQKLYDALGLIDDYPVLVANAIGLLGSPLGQGPLLAASAQATSNRSPFAGSKFTTSPITPASIIARTFMRAWRARNVMVRLKPWT